MSTYKSQYTGAQIDEAVGKALAGSTSGSTSGSDGKTFKLILNIKNLENREYELPCKDEGRYIFEAVRAHPLFLWESVTSLSYMNILFTGYAGVKYREIKTTNNTIQVANEEPVESISLNGVIQSGSTFTVYPDDVVEIILYTWSSGGSNE